MLERLLAEGSWLRQLQSTLDSYGETCSRYQKIVKKWVLYRDYINIAFAATTACLITHPIDLIKVRYQLQGELKPSGKYPIKYGSLPQSVKRIIEVDGTRAFYRGLAPALSYQFIMNVVRGFTYEKLDRFGLTSNMDEEHTLPRQLAACCLSGSLGAVIASPAYLAKIQTQSQASPTLAVGWQHDHPKSRWVIWNCFRGHKGYLRSGFQGGTSAVMRISVASSLQLLVFTNVQHYVHAAGIKDALTNSCVSGVISAVPIVLLTNPLDVICTRMYNQELAAYYSSNRECAEKLLAREGWSAFYKGAVTNYLRTAPHIVLTLIAWDHLKRKGLAMTQLEQSYFDFSIELNHQAIKSKFDVD